jgi:hypothetical protein
MFCNGIYYYPGEADFAPARWGSPWAWRFIGDRSYRTVQSSDIVRVMSRRDLRAVVGHFAFGLHTLIDRPTTYATMFRHPLERVASLYWHLKRWGDHDRGWPKHAGFTLHPKASLDEFVRDYRLRELDNDQTRRVAGTDPKFGGCTRSLLEKAKSNIERHFSLLGVTERFEDTLRVAADVLGWSPRPQVVKLLLNERHRAASSIMSRTKEAILERNALDLELYSFANAWLNEYLGRGGAAAC